MPSREQKHKQTNMCSTFNKPSESKGNTTPLRGMAGHPFMHQSHFILVVAGNVQKSWQCMLRFGLSEL